MVANGLEVSLDFNEAARLQPALRLVEILLDHTAEGDGCRCPRLDLLRRRIAAVIERGQGLASPPPGLIKVKLLNRAELEPTLLCADPILNDPHPRAPFAQAEAEARQCVVKHDAVGLAFRQCQLGDG